MIPRRITSQIWTEFWTEIQVLTQAARQALCLAFAARLVGEVAQSRLTKARAFPVTDMPPLYAGSEGMAQLEAALSGLTLRPEPAFGGA